MVAMAVACPPSLACRHRLAALPIGNLHSPDPISHNPSALYFSSRSRASYSIASCWRSNPSCGLSELKRQLFTGVVERKKRMIGHERMRMRMRIVGKVAQEAEVRAMEDEQMQSERPATLLREGEGAEGVDAAGGGAGAMRARYEGMIRRAQDEICAAVEGIDGGQFREDVWTRAGGGGGISRVLQNGNVWEKAGVNVSVVYGTMPPEAYRAATGSGSGTSAIPVNKAGRIPFFAAGISSVMHPKNPFAPTVHFNYRYFETDAPEGVDGAPRSWWFGGGTDLTPSYIIEEDVSHFHKIQKQACDKFDPEYYPKFKKWCDNYFLIKHRGERRGLGGIFFDDLNDRDPADLFAFSTGL
ncbi:hypothetical protein O6H91_03G085600 [Diphasiastrum complanatum]|uniref:Uncharacterized protein n=1 Tax=Diphasiastrum complanatum TaxID=34168 RepID=A0ACC2E900_DIPCM|nr:hypothetical protein O6H91_03G085600 [Diphasiastrum complanatum]